jgi:uncharacterized protein involved in outer membrane biogenesis
VRSLKWVLGCVGVMVVLLVAAAVIVTSVVNPNRHRGEIEAIVGDLNRRPSSMQGEVQLRWSPWLGLQLGATRLDMPHSELGPAPLAAKPVEIQIDATRLSGWLERCAAAHRAWRFDFHGDDINLGRDSDLDSSRSHKPFELALDRFQWGMQTGHWHLIGHSWRVRR